MLRHSKVCVRCIPIGLTLVCLLAVRPIQAATIGPTIAYVDPADMGNQFFTGSLGQNFTVNGTITVSQLGVFDSNQDGIIGTLSVAIFNSTGTQVTPTVNISGMAGTVINGDRFLSLSSPVTLGPGNYQLTTAGWGVNLNGNRFCVNNPVACGGSPAGGPFIPPTLNTGGGLITYTGVGFLSGGGPIQLVPTFPGDPPDQYNAGSFIFTPEPETAVLLAVGLLLLVLAPRLRRQPSQ